MSIDISKNISVWGDSIMQGVVYDEVKKKYKAMKDNAISYVTKNTSLNIDNNSFFGYTAVKGLKKLTRALKKGTVNDVVLLEYGGNDSDRNWVEVSENPNIDHKPKTPLPEFRKTMNNMIDLLMKNHIEPILMTLPPINGQRYFDFISKIEGVIPENVLKWMITPYTMYRQQERYSMEVEKISLLRGLKLIDVRSVLLNMRDFDTCLCADGIHINSKGQEAIGKIFVDFISHN